MQSEKYVLCPKCGHQNAIIINRQYIERLSDLDNFEPYYLCHFCGFNGTAKHAKEKYNEQQRN